LPFRAGSFWRFSVYLFWSRRSRRPFLRIRWRSMLPLALWWCFPALVVLSGDFTALHVV